MTDDPIHEWFGLSYAAYLVLPRSILQSLPDALQERLVAVLEEIEREYPGLRVPPTGTYRVTLHDGATGRYIADPLRDYERGRRHVTADELRALVGHGVRLVVADTDEPLPFEDDYPYCECCGDLIEDGLFGMRSEVCGACLEECEDYEDERW